MTHAELERIEAIFRSPPSTGVLAEHGLALCAELRVRMGHHAELDAAGAALDLAVNEALTVDEFKAKHFGDLPPGGVPDSFAAALVDDPLADAQARRTAAEAAAIFRDRLAEADQIQAGLSHDASAEHDADPTPPHSPKAKKGKR